MQVDSSVLNELSSSRLDQQHIGTQNHNHHFSEQKLHVCAEITSEQNLWPAELVDELSVLLKVYCIIV